MFECAALLGEATSLARSSGNEAAKGDMDALSDVGTDLATEATVDVLAVGPFLAVDAFLVVVGETSN